MPFQEIFFSRIPAAATERISKTIVLFKIGILLTIAERNFSFRDPNTEKDLITKPCLTAILLKDLYVI